MRWTFSPLILGLMVLEGCESGSPRADERGATVAVASLPGLSAGSTAEVQDTMPMVVRRVWYTNTSDIWSGPSADGRLLPLTDWSGEGSGGAVAVHDLLTGETRRVTPEANPFPAAYAEYSAISPDGRRIAVTWWSNENGYELRLSDVDGLEPRVLYYDPSYEVRPLQWSDDGQKVLVFAVDDSDNLIGLVTVEDGSLRVLKRMGQRGPFEVAMSPDSRYVIYDDEADGETQRDVFVIDLATGEERRLVEHPADDLVFGWAPDGGHVLFASDRNGTMGTWLLPVSEGVPIGPPVLVKPDLWRADPLGFDGNGSFYYVVWMHMPEVFLGTMDLETGQLLDRPTPASSTHAGSNSLPEWSPDGGNLAYFSARRRWREFGRETLVIRSVQTGEERQFQPMLASYMNPRWSPDGKSLLVRARDKVSRGFFGIDVQTGEVEPLLRFPVGSPNIASRAEWIEEGRALLYWWPPPSVAEGLISENERDRFTLRVLDLDSGDEEVVYEADVSPRFAVSPDRQRVAFSAGPDGEKKLMVMPVEGGDPDVILGADRNPLDLGGGTEEIQWSPDGRFLYFQKGRTLWRVPVDGGRPEELGWFEELGARPWLRFQPGGTRVALMWYAGEGGGEVWVMEDFLPGPEDAEGERRAP